jgi:hypothetical protein
MAEAADGLVAELGDAWAPFADSVAALADEDWDRRTAAGWTVKEMLAHVAFWDEAAVPVTSTTPGKLSGVGRIRRRKCVTGSWPRMSRHWVPRRP